MENKVYKIAQENIKFKNTDEIINYFLEDYKDILDLIIFNYAVTGDPITENSKILNRISYLLDKPCTENNVDIEFNIITIRRQIETDYMREFSSCHKLGYLNIIDYMNLIIEMIKNKIRSLEDNETIEIVNMQLENIIQYREEVLIEFIESILSYIHLKENGKYYDIKVLNDIEKQYIHDSLEEINLESRVENNKVKELKK